MPPLLTRESLLGFARASADLLLETDAAGTVLSAAGTLGASAAAEALVGRDVATLFDEGDRQIWPTLCAGLLSQGRLPPTVMRLVAGDAQAAGDAPAAWAIAGSRLPGNPARLCLTFGRLPVVPDRAPAFTLDGITRSAEVAAQAGTRKVLGMVEVTGWSHATEKLGPERVALLEDRLAGIIAADSPDAAAIGDGRFSVLANSGSEVVALSARLEDVVRAEGHDASVATMLLSVDPAGLTPQQTARTLRFALDRFARGGVEPLLHNGIGKDLDGFLREATTRARTLRRTIEERSFHLVFQPVVGLEDRVVHHHEALLRPPPSTDRLLRSTQDFVLLAETLGLAEQLDAAVLEVAADALIATGCARIAVNLSGVSIQSAAFREQLAGLLRARPNLPQRLLVELTETAAVTDLCAAAETMQLLRRNGVLVCLDDFGAGAAAFRYLREFPVDFVKIDGSYVAAALARERDRHLLAGMVEIAAAGGARIIAERIEREEEAAMMRHLGVALGQGWLFGRPGPLPLPQAAPTGAALSGLHRIQHYAASGARSQRW